MHTPTDAVERFYAELAKLPLGAWLLIVIAMTPKEYEASVQRGQAAVEAFLDKPTDPEVMQGLLVARQSIATEVTHDLWPDLHALRSEMRPRMAPAADELSEETYEAMRAEASRRVWWGAAGVATASVLEPALAARLYQPFEGFVPLTSVTTPAPEFVTDLALALQISSLWAVERGPGTDEEKTQYWSTVFPRWLWEFNGGEGMPLGVPNMSISMALMTAISGFVPDGGGKSMRYIAQPLVRKALRLVRFRSDDEVEQALTEFTGWTLRRQERRWIANRLARVMLAMFSREQPDGARPVSPPANSNELIKRALGAMGFEGADLEPPAPADGKLVLPPAFSWWEPEVVNVSPEAMSGGVGSSGLGHAGGFLPPDAQRRNLMTLLEPDHFNPAREWYLNEVLPFIDDYGPAPKGSEFPVIGLSRFGAGVPYARQAESVRLFLWALADAMLVAAQAREESGGDASAIQVSRLPLIRAIWADEINEATDAAIGIGPTQQRPDVVDPGYVDFALKWGDARERIESAMRRFLRLPTGQEDSATDGLSAFAIAIAARNAAVLGGGRAASRAGCAAGAIAISVVAVVVGRSVRPGHR